MKPASSPHDAHRQDPIWADLPLDRDIEPDENLAPGGPFDQARRSRWPRLHRRSVVAVGVGGILGGLARYELSLAWPTPSGHVPWATLFINTSGAFVLALLLILVQEVFPPTTYVRPFLGTGFCGAYTTFSSVVVATNQLGAHQHQSLAIGYLFGSLIAGLAAASFGIIIGRAIAASRARGEKE